MSISQFNAKDYEVISRDYADLKESAMKRCANEEEIELVQKAFEFANEAHKNIRRRSGEPYILHPIAVAKIVVNEIGLGCKSIVAALLHDVVEDTDYTVEDIKRLFGERIAMLVDGLTKIKTVLDNQDKNTPHSEYTQSLQAENFRRILLTLNDDVRVVLIKLADRLHNCRTIEFMPEYKRDKILSETMFIFVPLAHRLGLYEVKSEMENIWLRYKEPDAYNDIMAKINRDISDKEKDIDLFIKPIREKLKEADFDFVLKKRVKTPYSIWHKMKTKNVTFEQIYDLYAVRIIFVPKTNEEDTHKTDSEREQCYHVFSLITSIYRYKAERMRDWAGRPKSNGYEALHCTLMSNQGIWIEVQIRTKRMDDIAEKGIAAHWAYKKDGYIEESDNEMDKWLTKVKEILVNPDVNALDLLDIIHNDLTAGDIVVFTPKGDQKTIQKGATALDFAYSIHSEIGNKAIAAKVNQKLVPLSYQLKIGDLVEIITAENQTPKKEWLQFLKTGSARNMLINYFRKHKIGVIRDGKELLEQSLKKEGKTLTPQLAARLADNFGLSDTDALYFRFAMGLIRFDILTEIVNFDVEGGESALKGKIDRNGFVINSPDDKHKYVIADCCNPIPGDSIVGFLSPDGTVTVHKKSCHVAGSLATKHGDWIVTPRWHESESVAFPARLMLRGIDRVGLLNDITKYISLIMGVNMRRLELGTEDGIFEGTIDLYVPDANTLRAMIENLKAIDGIQSVLRSENL